MASAVNYSRSAADAEETLALVKAHGVPALLGQANVANAAAMRKQVA